MNNIGTLNGGVGPHTFESMINRTATSTFGTFITSPAGFYVIPTVKVIRVPAVTQANGQLACTTSSTYSLVCQLLGGPGFTSPYDVVKATAVFTGMNDQMQAYYNGQKAPSVLTTGNTSQETLSRTSTKTTGYPSAMVISFSTPYLHFPSEAATEATFSDDNVVVLRRSLELFRLVLRCHQPRRFLLRRQSRTIVFRRRLPSILSM